MNKIIGYASLFLFVAAFMASCGGGGAASTTPAAIKGEATVDSGATNVKMSESFGYTFPKAVSAASVTEDTFYVSPASSSCGEKLAGVVTCASDTSCTFTADSAMDQCVEYSLCLTNGISFADGTAFDGDTINFTTLCCATYFGSNSCTYVGDGNPDMTSTFSYQLIQMIESGGQIPAGASACICQVASDAGESGCIGISSLVAASTNCGFQMGGSSLEHQLGEPDGPSAEGQVFTVDIDSTDTAFTLYVDYGDHRSDGEDISNMYYSLNAMESERNCDGSCSTVAYQQCHGQSECSVGITGVMVGTFLNQYEASYHLLTRYNNNQCVDVWFEWNASGIDPDFDESGTNSSDLLYLRLQKTAGACN